MLATNLHACIFCDKFALFYKQAQKLSCACFRKARNDSTLREILLKIHS